MKHLLIAAALGGTTLSAAAAPIAAGYDISPARAKLVVPPGVDVNDPRFLVGAGAYTGVGGLIINTNRGDRAGYSYRCTGALINPRVVLTAGHCLDFEDESATRIRFRTGSGTEAADAVNYEAGYSWVHPNFVAETFFEGWDVAAVILDTPVSNGEDIYGVYSNPGAEIFQIHDKVGFGATGTLDTGATSFDQLKRAGYNNYEFFGSDIFSDINDQVLLYDSDNGNPENDAFAFIWNLIGLGFISDTGIYYSPSLDQFTFGAADGSLPPTASDWELVEVNSAGGDSGGPTFIDGRIAGITSFGITGAIFDGDCGPGFIDPLPDPTGFCTDSSAGELSGDTRVSAFLEEMAALQAFTNIRALNSGGVVRARAVPAPAALALFGLGAVALGIARRRR